MAARPSLFSREGGSPARVPDSAGKLWLVYVSAPNSRTTPAEAGAQLGEVAN
jgi:hypothetical protein